MRLISRVALSFCLWTVGAMAFGQSQAESSYKSFERYKGTQERTSSSIRQVYRIRVNTQSDLANVNTSIRNAIKNGKKNIEVQLAPGVFYYDRLAFYLYKINDKKVSISIKGNQTYLVAAGKDYTKGASVTAFNRNNLYLDKDKSIVNYYGDVQQTLSKVEVLDATSKECRVKVGGNRRFIPGLSIQMSEWFHCPVYEVTKVKDGYVHFIADDLSYDKAKQCYNVQYDNAIGSVNPRVRFIDPELVREHDSAVHECSVAQLLILYQMKLKSFSISGIHFLGCAHDKEALMYFRDVEAETICIQDCQFEWMNNLICNLKNTDNFVFKGNEVKNCSYGALNSAVDCSKTVVKDNSFYRMGKSWTNCSVVACHGADFVVSGNKFEDFGYSAVSTGYNHKWGSKRVTSGIIEDNEICYGNEYFSNCEKYTLMDGGAVYVSTLSDKIIVRYNYIHDYRGVRSNRAIYCDDGAMNVKIYGNVIRNIPGAHAVFSWRAKSVNSKVSGSNDGICFYYNVIWGNYKLDERPNSSCIHGKNLILYAQGEQAPKNELVNFKYQENDIVFSGAEVADGKLVVPQSAKKELKLFPTYEKMSQWLK